MTDFKALLARLASHDVRFILIGGLAAVAHGFARLTQDIDIVYSRTPENLKALVVALRGLDPYLREAPPGLPFEWSEETLQRGPNFTLTTRLGDVACSGRDQRRRRLPGDCIR